MAPRRPRPRFPFNFEPNLPIQRSINFSIKEQKAWLRRSATWRELDPNVWEPRKVLGAGSYGICGLWRRRDNNQTLPQHIVVKQTQGEDANESLKWESYLLGEIMHASNGTNEHIIKLYKASHMAPGTGASRRMDQLPFEPPKATSVYDSRREVARMYIEYCEGGDFSSLLKRRRQDIDEGGIFPEEDIWRWLYCLARALKTLETGLERGQESDRAAGSLWDKYQSIVHFDIKWQNVLVGTKDENHHRHAPIYKLADFGLALPCPKEWQPLQNGFTWKENSAWRADSRFYKSMPAPEQYFGEPGPNQHPRHATSDSQINMWQLGYMLHELITGEGGPDLLTSFEAPRLRRNESESFAYKTFAKKEVMVYRDCSAALIELLFSLLAYDPKMRPNTQELEMIVGRQLQIYDQMHIDEEEEIELPPIPPLFDQRGDYWGTEAQNTEIYSEPLLGRGDFFLDAPMTRAQPSMLLKNHQAPLPPSDLPSHPRSPKQTRNTAGNIERQNRYNADLASYQATVQANNQAPAQNAWPALTPRNWWIKYA